MLEIQERRDPLIDYEIDVATKRTAKIFYLESGVYGQIVDILKANAAIFLQPDNVDYSEIERLREDSGAMYGMYSEKTKDAFFMFSVIAHLPDSANLNAPKDASSNSTMLVGVGDDVVGHVIMQELAEIDEPSSTSHVHYKKLTVNGEYNGKKLTVSSEYPGVKSRARRFSQEDGEKNIEVTNTVSGNGPSVTLWSCIYAMDVKEKMMAVEGVKIYIVPSNKSWAGPIKEVNDEKQN